MRRRNQRIQSRSGHKNREFERLELRMMLASDWQNPFLELDVNRDRLVTPIDVLLPINEINNPTLVGPDGMLPDRIDHLDKPFWNANGDDVLSSNDALQIINALNRQVPPVITAELLNDTATAGTTNQDRLTSSPLIVGTATDRTGVQSLTATVDSAMPINVTRDVTGNSPSIPASLSMAVTTGRIPSPSTHLTPKEIRLR